MSNDFRVCVGKLLVLFNLAFKHGRVTNNNRNLNFEHWREAPIWGHMAVALDFGWVDIVI